MAGGNNNTTNAVRGTTTGNVGGSGVQASGPLADLYTNKYTPTNLKYPSNLDSDTRGHIIQFSINDTIPASYIEGNLTPTVDGQTGGVAASPKNSLFFQPQRTRIAGTIALYIPDSISETYAASYTDVSVLDAISEGASALSSIGGKDASGIAKFFSGAGSAVKDSLAVAQSSAGKLAGSALGVAINPGKQIIFDGIDFRTFAFSFTFSPASIGESNVVHDIVRTFKYHAAPTVGTGVGAAFFTPPSSFTIEYLYNGGNNGGSNIYLNKIAECVLESITVNYGPNGIWSAFNNTGAPTQVTLSLSFKELEIIDRTKINQGY